MIGKSQIKQQEEAIKYLRELVLQAEDGDSKQAALDYCDGCLTACKLGLEVLAKQEESKKADAKDTETTAETKPKKRTTRKKKAEPVEEPATASEAPQNRKSLKKQMILMIYYRTVAMYEYGIISAKGATVI